MKKRLLSLLALAVLIGSTNYDSYALSPFTRFKNWFNGYSTVESAARKVEGVDLDKVGEYAKKTLKQYYEVPCIKRNRMRSPKVSENVGAIEDAMFSTAYSFMATTFCGYDAWQPSYIKSPYKNVFISFVFPNYGKETLINLLEERLMNIAYKYFECELFNGKINEDKHGYERFKDLHEKLIRKTGADDCYLTRPVARFMNSCELLKLVEQELEKVTSCDLTDKKYMILIVEDRSQDLYCLSRYHVELMERKYSVLPN